MELYGAFVAEGNEIQSCSRTLKISNLEKYQNSKKNLEIRMFVSCQFGTDNKPVLYSCDEKEGFSFVVAYIRCGFT
jgi:hypothetical protein